MSETQNTSIAIFVHNSKLHYSGGRYHAFVLALSLVNAGFDVTLVTDNIPVFYKDFEGYPERSKLKIHIVKSFKQKYLENAFDIVVLVPGMDGYHNVNIYKLAVKQKKEFSSKLILLNFESPNWFNEFSKVPRAEYLWAGWRFVALYSDAILSSARESSKYASRYYGVGKDKYVDCSPAINTRVCENIPDFPREKNILCFYRRVNGAHKGGSVVLDLMVEEMQGYTIKFLCGFDRPEDEEYDDLQARAEFYGINIDIVSKASDYQKFVEYKKARLLIFPSQFEGFGYPPVEALASGASCVCYDLPVLKEICGDKLIYAKHGDVDDLREKVRDFLIQDQVDLKIDPDFVMQHSIEAMGSKLSLIIRDIKSRGDNISVENSSASYHYLTLSYLFIFYRLIIFVVKRSNLFVKGKLYRCARLGLKILRKIRNITKRILLKLRNITKRILLKLRNIIKRVLRLGFRILRKCKNILRDFLVKD